MKTRDYYKKMGICPMCKKKPAFGNFVHCADCLEKIALNNIKYRAKKHEEYERRNNLSKVSRAQRKRSLHKLRKAQERAWNALQPLLGKKTTQ